MTELPLNHRKRCKRWNNPGQAHFLTFSCFHRQQFLSKDRTRQWLLDAIHKASKKHQYLIWAWVIMPEHVHLIVRSRQPEYDISDFLKSVKLSVARRALRFLATQPAAARRCMEDRQPDGKIALRFWQRGGGYDRNLRTTDELWEKIVYTHMNPVKRGLCARPTDWPWSSAGDFTRSRKIHLLPIDFETIPPRRQSRA